MPGMKSDMLNLMELLLISFLVSIDLFHPSGKGFMVQQ